MGARRARWKGRFLKHRRAASGLPSAAVEAKKQEHPPKISVFAYGPDGVDEHTDVNPEELPQHIGKRPVTWIDVDGLGDTGVIDRVGKVLDLHPLAIEDATNLYQRPK